MSLAQSPYLSTPAGKQANAMLEMNILLYNQERADFRHASEIFREGPPKHLYKDFPQKEERR